VAVARRPDLASQTLAGSFIVKIGVDDLDGDLLADRPVERRKDRPGRAVAPLDVSALQDGLSPLWKNPDAGVRMRAECGR